MPRTERIKELLSFVAGVAHDRRHEALQRRYPDDQALFGEVLELAECFEQASDGFLEPLIVRHGDPGPFGVQVPPQIGPYKIGGLLGRGAAGAVYEGIQEEPVRRRVAIKILGGAGDPRLLQRRFEIERDALCRLEHPGIARVLDAGIAETGAPYLVTELVDGPTITEFADQELLPLRMRLELVRDVALAVHHAHSRALLHRDLKPSNILVATQDGRPAPKVIDFGVAKLLDEPGGASQRTSSGQIIGTIGYMAPEQAGTSTSDIDVRADVFALGVVLYETLCGELPFPVDARPRDGEPSSPARVRRASPPSSAKTSTSVRGISSELDCLVLKAIEPDRDLRYRTALEFAEDIDRYLQGLTIAARPPTKSYLIRKFVHRNKVSVGFGAVAALAVVVGLAASLISLERSIRDRERLADQERATREALADADDVVDLLDTLLSSTDPIVDGPDVMLRDALDRASGALQEPSPRSSGTDARARVILARSYASLGRWPDARDVLQPFVETTPGAELRELWTRSLLDYGEMQYRSSDFTEAVATLRTAASSAAALDAPALEWRAQLQLANALQLIGSRDEASQIYAQLLAPESPPPAEIRAEEEAAVLISSGVLLHRLGDRTEGLQRVEQGRDLIAQTLGRDHPSWVTATHNRAILSMAGGDLESALPALEEAVDAWLALVGPDHTNTLNAMVQLGDVRRRLGDLEAAETVLAEAVPRLEEHLGPSNRLTLKGLQDLAELHAAQERWPLAIEEIQRVADIHADHSGDEDPRTWYARAQVVQFRAQSGEAINAADELSRLERAAEERFGADDRFVKAIRRIKGDVDPR